MMEEVELPFWSTMNDGDVEIANTSSDTNQDDPPRFYCIETNRPSIRIVDDLILIRPFTRQIKPRVELSCSMLESGSKVYLSFVDSEQKKFVNSEGRIKHYCQCNHEQFLFCVKSKEQEVINWDADTNMASFDVRKTGCVTIMIGFPMLYTTMKSTFSLCDYPLLQIEVVDGFYERYPLQTFRVRICASPYRDSKKYLQKNSCQFIESKQMLQLPETRDENLVLPCYKIKMPNTDLAKRVRKKIKELNGNVFDLQKPATSLTENQRVLETFMSSIPET